MKKEYKKDGNYYNVYNDGILVGSTKNIKQLKKDGYIENDEIVDNWELIYKALPQFIFNKQGSLRHLIETPTRGDGTTFIIEVSPSLLTPRDKKSFGEYLFKNEYLKNRDITSTIFINTYYHDNEGNCFGCYNPTIKNGLINPETITVATPQNIIQIIQKTYEMYKKEVA
ncbi:hypothetical protein SAMN05421767_10426 [Granulicatella balaenopterae]|uniref:Uncharacterized protein n=1 Tax=Granulicatella balaenopterae TaxID=137733 RepID=A0A1H9I1E3_9LACT|nr:hypothetical protein [Granulicatella balaenopterae]SEQ68419.1 hypothetical protein SAMN05421767_10426 [Granulicatella balaenopterae]